jgi:glycine/D-amino acid oxidase-like deaminating enzyme/nitrite reductase/ring-hydroxylating ferredoxin subunit
MNGTAQQTRSVWISELPEVAPALRANEKIEIAIIGAGIAGLTTAYLLARAGKRVLVLDSGQPGGGMTSRTTAHLSNALDDRWYEMIALRGETDATLAAQAHSAAIDLIEYIQDHEAIDCDFARVDGYLIPGKDDHPTLLERERVAAHTVGLTGVSIEPAGPPGMGNGPALRFPHQARFHPLKYLRGLLACIARNGGRVVCAHVMSVENGDRSVIKTKEGFEVEAASVVVATNVPINDRVAVHTKQAPYRTYVIAGEVSKGEVVDALIWDTDSPYHYVRLQPSSDGGLDIVIIGGEDHKSGQADDMSARFLRLEHWARARFPSLRLITWRWSGQVMETVDFLGFLGRNPGQDNVFIISGDSGQGMTHGTIGGIIISDLILGRANPWEKLFDPSRVTIKAAGTYARENLNVAGQMSEHLRPGDVSSTAEISIGTGAIIRRGVHKVAVYKKEDSSLIECSAVCPHIGCVVAWNPLEKCWDCPCHGSQFAVDGAVINGPATRDLKRLS